MCMCQIGISTAQLAVCAYLFKQAPIRNSVNIALCAASLPLAVAGLSALHLPEEEYSVLTMHFYQWFFVLRAVLVTFDYGFLLKTRVARHVTTAHVIVATLVLIAILILQVLNSLLVMAVIRIMRKKRNQRVAADAAKAQAPVDERTPLLS